VSEVWWLTGGTEQCTFCFVLFHYEVQERCDSCGIALCPFCAELHAAGVHCPDCVRQEGEAAP
jgi:hypothetical protein